MRIRNAMLYSAIQLWQLVTAMQHFNQNFVITGLSLSLTPSPLDAVPETVQFTSVKQWMWGLQNWAWHLEARMFRLHGALASQWQRTGLSQSVREYTVHLIFWSCHPLILTITDKVNHFNEAKFHLAWNKDNSALLHQMLLILYGNYHHHLW